MTDTVNSLNGIPVRLPDERWQHIIQRHADIADQKDLILRAIAAPERLLAVTRAHRWQFNRWILESGW